jgi:hypothetical protein
MAAAIAIVGLLVAWTLDAGREIGYPLVQIEQGVTVVKIDGLRLFSIRDGASVTFLGKTTPGTGTDLVWCPIERFFVSPEDAALFTREGEYVAGPAKRDMDLYPHEIRQDTLQVFLLEGPTERPRSNGQVSGEAGEAYNKWKADPDTPQKFCQNPVG